MDRTNDIENGKRPVGIPDKWIRVPVQILSVLVLCLIFLTLAHGFASNKPSWETRVVYCGGLVTNKECAVKVEGWEIKAASDGYVYVQRKLE